MTNEDIQVLIADDHPLFRFGLRALLEAEPGTAVIGEATNGREAVAMSAELQPDVIVMDINMPDLNGIEATKQILAHNPDANILIMTMFDDDTVFAAMRAGARGYLLKGVEGEETLQAIRAVAAGQAIFSPKVAERLIQYFAAVPRQGSAVPPFPDLTPRELEVLQLIAQGLTNNAIAERLVLSPKTVRNQVSTIFSKLQVANRAEAIVRAREAGLGQ
ncbi:MAG: response regulator transcription factor [Candidatus Promineifilaceae bacterium]|nr:response regulator transcription factor [Candidatus Promineifilaceae bacterium]